MFPSFSRWSIKLLMVPVHWALCILLLNETAWQVYHSCPFAWFSLHISGHKQWHAVTLQQYGLMITFVAGTGMGKLLWDGMKLWDGKNPQDGIKFMVLGTINFTVSLTSVVYHFSVSRLIFDQSDFWSHKLTNTLGAAVAQ